MDGLRETARRQGHKAIASAIPCSLTLVSHWLTGRKRVSEAHAMRIEHLGYDRADAVCPRVQWERDADGRLLGYRVPAQQAA